MKKCDHVDKWRPMPVEFSPTGSFQYTPKVAIYCRGCGATRVASINSASYYESHFDGEE